MKDHEIALLVNELTNLAREFGDHQSLRSRVSEAVQRAVQTVEPTPMERDDQERMRFAAFMVQQGYGREAVAPPKPPMRHYRSAHIEDCWMAWCGSLKAHGLT